MDEYVFQVREAHLFPNASNIMGSVVYGHWTTVDWPKYKATQDSATVGIYNYRTLKVVGDYVENPNEVKP